MIERDGQTVEVNGIGYRWPPQPVVVVCIDGGDPRYFDHCLRDGIIPNIARFMNEGFNTIAECVVPSFTTPNNISIITGRPPSVHGMSANFFLNPETGEAVVMDDPRFIRCPTLLGEFSKKGKVVAITARDKLRRLLGKDMDIVSGSINFSSEKAYQCTTEENGIEDVLYFVGMPLPEVYSAGLSLFVIEAGIKLLERDRPDLMYLSFSDYVQHKHAPGTPAADDFMRRIDEGFGRLAKLGAVVALTADHGMNDKSLADGSPKVIYLQDLLDREFWSGSCRVILTVADPYVAHHGALGGYAGVYCYDGATPQSVMGFVREIPGVEAVFNKASACAAFELPPDRESDVVVIGDAGTVVGSSEDYHDLSALQGYRLRSHGSLSERRVPFILSAPVSEAYAARASSETLRNWNIFDYAINGTVA